MSHSLKSLRVYAAHLFAKAAWDVFPAVQLVGAEVSDIGFFYDLYSSHPIVSDMSVLFEERMRALIKNPPVMKKLEMIPSNAAALFEDHNQPFLSETCLDLECQFVDVIKIDALYILAEGPLERLGSFEFKILAIKNLGEGIFRIEATCFETKEAIKEFVKKWKHFQKIDYRELGVELQYLCWNKDEALFLPKGAEILEGFKACFLKSCQRPNNYPIISPENMTLRESHARAFHFLKMKEPVQTFYEWTRDGGSEHIFCSTEEAPRLSISSLQFILKIANILGFEYQVWLNHPAPKKGLLSRKIKEEWVQGVLWLQTALKSSSTPFEEDLSQSEDESGPVSGPSVQIRFQDELGRGFQGPKFEVDVMLQEKYPPLKNKVLIAKTYFPDLENLVFRLIEKYSSRLPDKIVEFRKIFEGAAFES